MTRSLRSVAGRIRRRIFGVRRLDGAGRGARIGTMHKTGTVLWSNILRHLEGNAGLRVWWSHRDAAPPERWDVEFNYRSEFLSRAAAPDLPTVVIIRDPRDIVVSAAKYHLWSDEKWLHNPESQFPGFWRDLGRTYQEAIRALPTDAERHVFEMDHAAGAVIRRIIHIRETWPDTRMFRLEDLVEDRDLRVFGAVFAHVGFEGPMLRAALDAARRNSLFSTEFQKPKHVQSGAGAQWRAAFDEATMAEFRRRFGDVAEQTGYPAA